MLRPVLLVGVGGSGGKTLGVMRYSLMRQLRSRGWTKDELPQAWQMLWIDSVSVMGTDGFTKYPPLPFHDYLGLVQPSDSYAAIRNNLAHQVPDEQEADSFAGWVPETVMVQPAMGAGQRRAIGRAISSSSLKAVKKALETKHELLAGAGAQAELAQVAQLFGQNVGSSDGPIGIVISSIAGGSGSGMYMDVLEAMKSVDTAYSGATGRLAVLFGPDVFNNLGGMAAQVSPNALAATGEAVSGVWSNSISAKSKALYAKSNFVMGEQADFGHSVASKGFGARCSFLVGAGNDSVTLGTQEQVYEAVGESLCSLVTDDQVQERLFKFVLTNVFLTNIATDMTKLQRYVEPGNGDMYTMPFASLGMARVTVGTDRFADYSSKVLARTAVEKFLWPTYEPKDPNVNKAPQELVDEMIARQLPTFKQRVSINNWLNAFQDDAAVAQRLSAFAQGGKDQVTRASGGASMPPTDWIFRFTQFFENFIPQVMQTENASRYQLTKKWVSDVQAELVEVTAQISIRNGFAVTGGLLTALDRDLTSAIVEVRNRINKNREFANVQAVAAKMNEVFSVGAAKIAPTDSPVLAASELLRRAAGVYVDVARLELTAAMFKDLQDNFLNPLIQSLELAKANLQKRSGLGQLDDGSANPFQIAPRFGIPVPAQFRPGSTEHVLLDPNNFEMELRRETQNVLKDAEKDVWQSMLVERGALGCSLEKDSPEEQTLISRSNSWIPLDPQAAVANVGAMKASFSVADSFESHVDRIARWIDKPDKTSQLAKFINQGIADYLTGGTPAERSDRLDSFKSAFSKAAAKCRPFAKISPSVRDAIHPDLHDVSDPYEAFVSTIPFDFNHPIATICQEILFAEDLLPAHRMDEAKKWFKTSPVSSIDIFTTNSNAMAPWVFENVMGPVVSAWNNVKTTPTEARKFWTMRRARPLVESLPISDLGLQAIIRGWYISSLFGARKRLDGGASGPKISVWSKSRNSFVSFPSPLLSSLPFEAELGVKLVEADDHLPIVLESLLLALASVFESANLEPLAPYIELMEEYGGRYQEILKDWVLSGTAPEVEGAPAWREKFMWDKEKYADQTPIEQRRSTVLDTLRASKSGLLAYLQVAIDKKNPYQMPPAFELREMTISALDTLADFVAQVSDKAVVESNNVDLDEVEDRLS
ncbi:MAG: hypothetical protein NT174_09505 [Actinobacteria bacterium]|nr:hypothetical protein [Actinomycetota bacterium]